MSLPPIGFPDPQLERVDNQTPFPHIAFYKMAPRRRFHDVVVIRGTFDLLEGRVIPSSTQTLPLLSDQWWDEENAERSSLKEVGDVLLYKPGTDVFVTGIARSPNRQALDRWTAGVLVANEHKVLLRHFLDLTGPRDWQYSLFKGWHLSDPHPADAVPLRYELAYGGAYLDLRRGGDNSPERWQTYKPNPSGSGHFDARTLDRETLLPGPQFEIPENPVRGINTAYPLTGFGPVARFWSARARYAGTYDNAWRQQFEDDRRCGIAPDFPNDFDLRFYQCAPEALISPSHLYGNERIALGGLIADAPQFSTRLPDVRFSAHILIGHGGPTKKLPLPLDTVHVDLDSLKVNLSWRLNLDPDMGVRAIALEQESVA